MNEIDLLTFITNLSTPAAYLSALAGVLLLFGQDWRLLLPIVLAQYGAVALVLTESLTLYVAFSKLVVGLFVMLIFYVTVRQCYAGGWQSNDPAAERMLISWPFRLILTVIILVSSWLLAQQTAEILSASYLFGTFSLLGLGVWGFVTTDRPLRIGLGLLMVLSGIELFYLSDNNSLLVVGFLASAHLITAVVIAYLTQARASFSDQAAVIAKSE